MFNEIEDAVGSRMLYRYTDIDVVELYVAHVLGGQGVMPERTDI